MKTCIKEIEEREAEEDDDFAVEAEWDALLEKEN